MLSFWERHYSLTKSTSIQLIDYNVLSFHVFHTSLILVDHSYNPHFSLTLLPKPSLSLSMPSISPSISYHKFLLSPNKTHPNTYLKWFFSYFLQFTATHFYLNFLKLWSTYVIESICCLSYFLFLSQDYLISYILQLQLFSCKIYFSFQ